MKISKGAPKEEKDLLDMTLAFYFFKTEGVESVKKEYPHLLPFVLDNAELEYGEVVTELFVCWRNLNP